MEYIELLNISVLVLEFLRKPPSEHWKSHWDEPMARDPGTSITNSFSESVSLKLAKPQCCHSLARERVVLRTTKRMPAYLRSTLLRFLLHLQRTDQLLKSRSFHGVISIEYPCNPNEDGSNIRWTPVLSPDWFLDS